MTTHPWLAAMDAYRAHQQSADRSPGTIRLHRYRLAEIARTGTPGPAAVTHHDLEALVGRPGLAPETKKGLRSTYRSFFRWALEEGIVDDDPSVRLPPIRVPATLARPAPEAVVVRAVALAPPRTRLMILLAAYAGLRAHEVAQVHSSDLADDVLIVRGKGRKERAVPIVHPDLLAELQRAPEGWLFPSPYGEHLTAGTVYKLVSRALPDRWTCHTLRHRMATRAYAGTRDLLGVGAVLGHSRPETTQRYVRLPDDALRAAARAAAA